MPCLCGFPEYLADHLLRCRMPDEMDLGASPAGLICSLSTQLISCVACHNASSVNKTTSLKLVKVDPKPTTERDRPSLLAVRVRQIVGNPTGQQTQTVTRKRNGRMEEVQKSPPLNFGILIFWFFCPSETLRTLLKDLQGVKRTHVP